MRSSDTQMDMFINRQPTARDFRRAAESSLANPYVTPDQAKRWHDYYLAQAQELEKQE